MKIFTGGTIYGEKAWDWMAVEGGRIRALGMGTPPPGQKIDLMGYTLLPGFIDSHVHLVSFGEILHRVDLQGVRTREEVVERLLQFIENRRILPGNWVVGWGFHSHEGLDADFLSDHFPHHPLLLRRACGHLALANRRALSFFSPDELASLKERGELVMGEKEPTGVLIESAIGVLAHHMPSPSVAEIEERIVYAQKQFHRMGITSVGTDDFESFPDKNPKKVIDAYGQLRERGKLSLRIFEQCRAKENLKEWCGYVKKNMDPDFFRISSVKLIADGSLGARTAALREPYCDANHRGLLLYEEEALVEKVFEANRLGLAAVIHAIGDRAIEMSLRAFRAADHGLGNEPGRMGNGLIHCQVTEPDLCEAMVAQKVVLYLQPIFLDYDATMVEARLGRHRAFRSNAIASLKAKGLITSFGSDCPVDSINPLHGIYEAVTRRSIHFPEAFQFDPKESLSLVDAMDGYHREGARALREARVGSLAPDAFADCILLEKDPFAQGIEELLNNRVLATFVHGRELFRA